MGYSMHKKSEVFYHFQTLKRIAEKDTSNKFHCIRFSGSNEYFFTKLLEYLQQSGNALMIRMMDEERGNFRDKR